METYWFLVKKLCFFKTSDIKKTHTFVLSVPQIVHVASYLRWFSPHASQIKELVEKISHLTDSIYSSPVKIIFFLVLSVN